MGADLTAVFLADDFERIPVQTFEIHDIGNKGRIQFNGKTRRKIEGLLLGDWELEVGGYTLVTLGGTEARFNESGDLRFKIPPDQIRMPAALSFISELLEGLGGEEEDGLSVRVDQTGVEATLSLPLPDLQGATFGISGLSLYAALGLKITDGFQIGLNFALARKEVPFALTIFILGGSGYVEANTLYTPSTGKVVSHVSLALMASASLALSLGPISGGVYVYFGVTGFYSSDGGRGLEVGILFLVRGRVSVLGIVTASVSLMLEAQYSGGSLVGRGTVSLRIKICWCCTLKVRESVTYTLAGSPGLSRMSEPRAEAQLASLDPRMVDLPSAPATLSREEAAAIQQHVDRWIDLLV